MFVCIHRAIHREHNFHDANVGHKSTLRVDNGANEEHRRANQGYEFAEFCWGTETRTIVRELVCFLRSQNVRFIFREQFRDSSPRILCELSELFAYIREIFQKQKPE